MARKKKAMNQRRRLRALEASTVAKTPDPAARALATHFRNRRHDDRKKAAAKNACRGKVSY